MKEEKEKAKLTLGIDKEVIKKAKEAGINISEITEQLLKVLTYTNNNESSYHAITNTYELFLGKIQEILRKYNVVISVGVRQALVDNENESILDEENIVLNGWGLFAVQRKGKSYKIKVEEVLKDLNSPLQILEELFEKLIVATELIQEKKYELNFALRILKSSLEKDDETYEKP